MLPVSGIVISAAFLVAVFLTFKRSQGSKAGSAAGARMFLGLTACFALGILLASVEDLFTWMRR